MFKNYFKQPTQIMFLDLGDINAEEKTVKLVGGIAYLDEIICGCCGCIISIKELLEDYEDCLKEFPWLEIYKPICELTWVNIEEEIRGQVYEMPFESE